MHGTPYRGTSLITPYRGTSLITPDMGTSLITPYMGTSPIAFRSTQTATGNIFSVAFACSIPRSKAK